MIDITCDDLTPKEEKIYRAIILEGLEINEICRKFNISRATVSTHLNNICHKKQIWGNSRLYLLLAQFVKEVLNAERAAADKSENLYIKGYNDGINYIKDKIAAAISEGNK